MKIHYLEIVSHDVDDVCKAYEIAHSINFSEPDEFLGRARTCALPDGSIVGIRGPLRDTEEPVVRPYWLVDNIEEAVAKAEAGSFLINNNVIFRAQHQTAKYGGNTVTTGWFDALNIIKSQVISLEFLAAVSN